jgi:hypothetical protein
MAMSPTLLSRVLCSGSQQGGMDNSRQRNGTFQGPGPPGIDLGDRSS